ncbi:MAG: response regulator transcription factor [Chloroflexota bacterium]
MSTTVLLVDDHQGFRREAGRLLRDAGFDVVGEAEDAADALRAATRLTPDLILLDIALPDGSGLDLVAPLRVAVPGVRVVLISSRRQSEFGGRIAASTADGFVDKVELGIASPAALAGLLRA